MKEIIPEGVKEQAVFFARMTDGGGVWCSTLRADVQAAIDRIAWDDVRVTRPRLLARVTDLAEARRELAGREAEVLALAKRLADVESRSKIEIGALRAKLESQRKKVRKMRIRGGKKGKRAPNKRSRGPFDGLRG
jgi:hypothetical protein